MDRYPVPKRTSRAARAASALQDSAVDDDAIEILTLLEIPTPVPPPAYRVGVKEMAPDERPRERMASRGSAALSTQELLAIIFSTGMSGESVLDYSQRILVEHGGLAGLARLDVAELGQIKGIGPARAATLRAVFELAARVAALVPDQRPKITTPDDIVNLIGVEMAALGQEQLRIVLLDTKHQVLAIRTVYQGSVNGAPVRPAELFREAIKHNAVAMVIVHNHPSGDPTPSGADVALTRELVAGGELLGIDVLDHLVIGQGRHASLRRLKLGFPLRA